VARILVVDDEESVRLTLRRYLKKDGHEVRTAESVTRALELMVELDFDVIVTDIIMPRLTGMDLLRKIHETSPDIQVVMITGEPTIDTAAEAVRAGASDYLSKPVTGEAIRKVVAKAADAKVLNDEKKRLEEENRRYQKHLEELVEERTEALRESEEKFRSISASAQDAIIMIDDDGHISYWNDAAGRIFGYTKEEADGQDVHSLIVPGRYYEDFKKGFWKFRETGEGPVVGKTLELVGIRKGGTEFPIEMSLSSVKLKGKRNATAIIRDITERKKAQRRICEEEEKRRNVVINTTHLIHTPLTIIKGNLELVRKGYKEMTPELLDKILERAEELHRLVTGELYEKIEQMTVETSDGFTPVRKIGGDDG